MKVSICRLYRKTYGLVLHLREPRVSRIILLHEIQSNTEAQSFPTFLSLADHKR
jgi:hypothetical protein